MTHLPPPALRRVGLVAATADRRPDQRPTLPARWLALLLRDLTARPRKERPCA